MADIMSPRTMGELKVLFETGVQARVVKIPMPNLWSSSQENLEKMDRPHDREEVMLQSNFLHEIREQVQSIQKRRKKQMLTRDLNDRLRLLAMTHQKKAEDKFPARERFTEQMLMMEFETRKQMIQELKNQAVMEFRQYRKNTTDTTPPRMLEALQATFEDERADWTARIQVLDGQLCLSADETGRPLSIPIDTLYLAPHACADKYVTLDHRPLCGNTSRFTFECFDQPTATKMITFMQQLLASLRSGVRAKPVAQERKSNQVEPPTATYEPVTLISSAARSSMPPMREGSGPSPQSSVHSTEPTQRSMQTAMKDAHQSAGVIDAPVVDNVAANRPSMIIRAASMLNIRAGGRGGFG